ncbi:MAG: hypothetical protein JRN21_05965 [Nitrososphaerota archaeon]|nr:hypothetical protein [Nitrososphaerota archaeon]
MYGLKKNSFLLDPKKDGSVFLVRSSNAKDYVRMIKGKLAIERSPHYVFYGLLGIGKTQLLRFIEYNLHDASCLYVETPPLHRRSTFLELYRSILAAYGREKVKQLLDEALESAGVGLESWTADHKGINLSLESTLGKDLANVVQKGLGSWNMLWRFLNGEKLTRTEEDDLEVWNNPLGPQDQVSVLQGLFSLHRELRRKPVILLIDEFELTRPLVGDSLNSFTEAIRDLVGEGGPMGTVFALTGRTIEEAPYVLTNETVRRRIGATNFITFDEYTEEELGSFIYEVIRYRRESNFDAKEAALKAKTKTKDSITAASYPFSEEAISLIINKVKLLKDQGLTVALRPKEAMELMDNVMSVAILDQAPVLDSVLVKKSI